MGIKSKGPEEDEGKDTSSSSSSLTEKQQEIFRNLDKQYSSARTATHGQRGSGLGFGS